MSFCVSINRKIAYIRLVGKRLWLEIASWRTKLGYSADRAAWEIKRTPDTFRLTTPLVSVGLTYSWRKTDVDA